ncbi:OLC1v1021556C1 [Oldenlandia corymbosa var. corymbosa]|uniref:OLC1v1021556C1 n=1 Tax=Oldenlandia corymbosa var. corymbosa TaxID=529605 RepID=A0AAV1BYE3_OLDCO|nr:OLC1v1021556C1 [Oldenlandia corymbosa var. corymbosa]
MSTLGPLAWTYPRLGLDPFRQKNQKFSVPSSSVPPLSSANGRPSFFRQSAEKKRGVDRRKEVKKKKKKKMRDVIPPHWKPPCNNECTLKYSALMQIPWRVFCKKGCDADGDTWEECLTECDEICYKDPVFKDQKWSAYIDRSPGATRYSEFDIHPEKVSQVYPNRPPPPPPVKKPTPVKPRPSPDSSGNTAHDIASTSA